MLIKDSIKGYIDNCDKAIIIGWIKNTYEPHQAMEVDIFIDEELIAHTIANLFRQDLFDAKLGNCAFSVLIPDKFWDGVEHSVTAYEVETKTLLQGSPKTFKLSPKLEQQNFPLNVAVKVKAIAFYLPQFHPIPENDEWWGKGFTEWTNVTKAKPLFEEHYQPRIPTDLGYYDLRCVEVREAQAELAKKYGIYGFCYYYYWFNGKRLLERPLDDMLKSGTPDFPFCLCWANENWSRRWDGSEHDILIEQKYSPENDKQFVKDLLPYFKDKRYIKIDEKPLLIVYHISIIPDIIEMVQRWREFFRHEGFGEIYLCAALTFGQDDAIQYGFDAEVQFPPHNLCQNVHLFDIKDKIINNELFTGSIFDYETVVKQSIQELIPYEADYLYRAERDMVKHPRFLTTMLSWDNSSRTKMRSHIYYNFSLPLYEIWLSANIEKTIERYDSKHQLIFINAWNEWGEGTYLEPDARYGLGYLETTYKCLTGKHSFDTSLAMLGLNFKNTEFAEIYIANIAMNLQLMGCEAKFSVFNWFNNEDYLLEKINRENHVIDLYQFQWWLEHPLKNQIYANKIPIAGWFISKLVVPIEIQIILDKKLVKSLVINKRRTDVFKHLGIEKNENNALSSYIYLPKGWNGGEVSIYVLFDNGESCKLATVTVIKLDFFSKLTQKYNFSLTALNNLRYIQKRYLLSKPILFVLHDIYPAGAQFYLLNLLKWLNNYHQDFTFEVLIYLNEIDLANLILRFPDAQVLLNELKEIAQVFYLKESGTPQNIEKIQAGYYSLLYLNTSVLGDLLTTVAPFPSPVIVHVHELLFWMKYNFGKEKFKECFAYKPHFIACSQAVKTNLVENFDVDANKTKVVYPFIPTEFLLKQQLREKAVVKAELCLPDNQFILTCCGTLDFRKGADLIVPVIVALKQYFDNFKIVWVGGFLGTESQDHVLFTIEKAQVAEHIVFTGHKKNPVEYINVGDIFLLLSREDPFPLVMAEAALCRKPIVGFANSGGISEFIEGGAGIIVPYLNIELLAKAIVNLSKSPEKIHEMGDVAYHKATTVYHQDKLAQEIVDIIQDTILTHASVV